MNNLSIKMLLMLVFTTAATMIADTGFPHGIGWAVLGISILGTSLTHLAQSALLPTQTGNNEVGLTDLIKGSIVALGNFLSQWAASYLPDAHINWQDMLKSAGMVLIMYMVKQFKTSPTKFYA